MSDNEQFPALIELQDLEKFIFETSSRKPTSFSKSLDTLFGQLGFTDEYVLQKEHQYKQFCQSDIESQSQSISKVVKDIVWGMVELDPISVDVLDCPLVQRLRYIHQNGLTHLVFPTASHTRLEHSLGVFAVASRYISSINFSARHSKSLAPDLKRVQVPQNLALDIKHAALLHDIGHLPFSHVLESIYASAPSKFKLGSMLVRDFEIAFMSRLRDVKSQLSEKISVAIILSPRFKRFYSALRGDDHAYLRVACLVSGMPLEPNSPGYSQLISGAVDCDKIDYLLRDSVMSNVPVAIDKARLFLNSSLVECGGPTIQKLIDRGVLGLKLADLDRNAIILVLNSSGVDTIEEVAFARATLYERVYRHSVTRNAERILAVAISEAAFQKNTKDFLNILFAFQNTDDTLLEKLTRSTSKRVKEHANKIRQRRLPKRAFAFSPEFYTPVVPYVSIFSGLSGSEARSVYFDEITSKDPFHDIVQALKERSSIFTSSSEHKALEDKIINRANHLAVTLRKLGRTAPKSKLESVFFIPLPEHSSAPSSCALVTREGELESSADYSRAPQLVSAKEVGRSFGFVTCDSDWAEIVFLAAQEVLYDYFGDEIGRMDLLLDYNHQHNQNLKEQTVSGSKIDVGVIRRFFVTEELATRRCRLNRSVLAAHRNALSRTNYYNRRPRLSTPVIRTSEISDLSAKFKNFSGQHGWSVTERTVLQFINQFPPSLRVEATTLLQAINFLDREQISKLLKKSIDSTLREIGSSAFGGTVHLVPLGGTSAHVTIELLKQEFRDDLKGSSLKISHSIHETLGSAKEDDAVIFVDDNIGSGTQFSAQLLQWGGLLGTSKNSAVIKEKGIEIAVLKENEKALLEKLGLWLATCVGTKDSLKYVKHNLKDSGLAVRGINFGSPLNEPSSSTWQPTTQFTAFLKSVGVGCLSHSDGSRSAAECQKNALGYGSLAGLTVTLWNVPTSTYTALWCPGIVQGEPWFPLFIRRGYVRDLVVA